MFSPCSRHSHNVSVNISFSFLTVSSLVASLIFDSRLVCVEHQAIGNAIFSLNVLDPLNESSSPFQPFRDHFQSWPFLKLVDYSPRKSSFFNNPFDESVWCFEICPNEKASTFQSPKLNVEFSNREIWSSTQRRKILSNFHMDSSNSATGTCTCSTSLKLTWNVVGYFDLRSCWMFSSRQRFNMNEVLNKYGSTLQRSCCEAHNKLEFWGLVTLLSWSEKVACLSSISVLNPVCEFVTKCNCFQVDSDWEAKLFVGMFHRNTWTFYRVQSEAICLIDDSFSDGHTY